MTKTVLKKLLPACMLASVALLAGCSDKDMFDPEKNPDYVGAKAQELDFSTSQTVTMQLNYDVPNGFASPFDLYAEYPLADDGTLRSDIEPLAAGINVQGHSQLSRVIPAYVDKLYLYSGRMFVPLLSYAKIENGMASFQQADVEIKTNDTRAGNAGDLWTRPLAHYLKTQDDFYAEKTDDHYQYDLIAPDLEREIPEEITKAISSTFKEAKIVDEKYYKDATITINKGKDGQTGAEVFVSILHSGAAFHNSLSYFVYTGGKDLTTVPKEEVQEFEIINIFQYADVFTNTVSTSKRNIKGLTPGKYIQLLYKNEQGEYVKEFPVGAQIGWILHPDSFNKSNFTVNSPGYFVRLYSVSYWNDANNKTNEPGVLTNNYNIFFSATDNEGNVYNCFGFEDQPKSASDGDCNDVVFHVLTNPIDAITPPPSITQEDVEQTEEKCGVLAFEDNWPKQGDYDLNDVVVEYNSEITYLQTVKYQGGVVTEESDVMVKKVEDTFALVHTGAIFNNAFSYKVSVSPDAIESITITDENKGTVTDYTDKISNDGEGFIIDLCPNVKNVIPHMAAVEVPQVYTVVMEFKKGAVLQDDFATVAAPYNPFICPAEHPGVEVHLPMYLPTGRADMSFFGTEDDRSDKNTLWYVSGENNKYPFAIHLDGAKTFGTPEEMEAMEEKRISITYPDFINWVNSGMTDFKDWYK